VLTLEFLDYDKNLVGTDTITIVSTYGALHFLTDLPAVTVPEAGTALLRVKLDGPPVGNVTATVNRISGDGDLAVTSGGILTFTAANWNIYRTVVFVAAEDPDAANGQATFRLHGIASGPGPTIEDKDVVATEADNDQLVFVTDLPAVMVPEGGTAPFRVKLAAQPLATVTVSVFRLSGDTDIAVQSGGVLQFTTSNWNTYQIVTLAAALDPDTIVGQATIRVQATAGATMPPLDLTAREGELNTAVKQWREY
jgi:cellulose 1,4-beta-cellobiosidase